MLSSDHEILEFFTRVKVEEPDKETALAVVRQACARLEQDYKVIIEEQAIERTVVLSADYILNERLPSKAIKILRNVCENLDYERMQREGQQVIVTVSDIIKVIVEISGVPQETLAGVAEEANYEDDLKKVQ